MNAKEIFDALVQQLTLPVAVTEKQAMIFLLLHEQLNISRSDILTEKNVPASLTDFKEVVQRLNQEEPLQYILGKAEFYGRSFTVNPSVLIPRPETELMVEKVIEGAQNQKCQLLDIGTGSGCIAITLALELPKATVSATDVDPDTLVVAGKNANQLGANIAFMWHNILLENIPIGPLDIVVSNPPYIRQHERTALARNVRAFEPPRALFVPDADPLIFHRMIGEKSMAVLKPGGLLMMEINEALGQETVALLLLQGYSNVKLIPDLDQKNRFVSGHIPD